MKAAGRDVEFVLSEESEIEATGRRSLSRDGSTLVIVTRTVDGRDPAVSTSNLGESKDLEFQLVFGPTTHRFAATPRGRQDSEPTSAASERAKPAMRKCERSRGSV